MYTQIDTYYMEANQYLHYCEKLNIYFLCDNSNYNLTIKKKYERQYIIFNYICHFISDT